MSRRPVGILGCTGIVGQRFVRMLHGHPDFEITVLSASAAKAGMAYGDAVAWAIEGEVPESCREIRLIEADPAALLATGVRVFFSALPSGTAGPVEAALRESGGGVFTNAGDHRGDPDVPILIPEVNAPHVDLAEKQAQRFGGGFIAAASNCSTAGLALALGPLRGFGIRAVTVSTYQSISGAGRHGLAAFDIAGNCIPFIRGEEAKIERETRKILGSFSRNDAGQGPQNLVDNGSPDGRAENSSVPAGPQHSSPPGRYPLSTYGIAMDTDMEIRASCCRVPVREGHLESVTVELADEPPPGVIESAIREFRGPFSKKCLPTAPDIPVILRSEDDRPQPALDLWAGTPERARGMAVTVGRLRLTGRVLRFFLLVHNTVRGAAGACVLNAELALRCGLLG